MKVQLPLLLSLLPLPLVQLFKYPCECILRSNITLDTSDAYVKHREAELEKRKNKKMSAQQRQIGKVNLCSYLNVT